MSHPAPDLLALLDRTATAWPNHAAVLEPDRADGARTTFAELRAEVAETRGRMAAHGVGRGDRVAYWAENRRELLVWQLAAAAAGALLVGVNTRYRAQELAHVLAWSRPALVIAPEQLLDLDLAELLREVTARLRRDDPTWPIPQVAVLPANRPKGTNTRDALDTRDIGAGAWWADEPAEPVTGASLGVGTDLAMAFTTSGSTGLPKVAAHDQAAIARHADDVAAAVDLHPGDVVLCALPLTGVFAHVPAMAALAAGAACLMVPVFDGATTVRQMREHGATHVFGGDDLFIGLREGWARDPVALPRWRVAGIASFVGRVEQLLPWLQECSPAVMCGVYGSSEVFSLVSIQDFDAPLAGRHVGGGRLVSPTTQVRAVDPVTEQPLPAGEVGLLQLRGPIVLQRYLRGTEELAPPLTAAGWFDTGDLGSVEEGGRRFTYAGRAGDAMRLRGFLVQPSEIELFLVEHPAIELVKVVGAERDGRPVAVAFVTVTAGHDLDPGAVMAWCRAELAAFKVPDRVVVLEAMPFTSGTNGSKVKASELRTMAAALLSTTS